MAKKRYRRKRSNSEKIMIILGLIIAFSMMLSLIVGLGSSGRSRNAPLPDGGQIEEIYTEPVGAIDGSIAPVAGFADGMTPLLM